MIKTSSTENLDMASPDLVSKNIDQIAALFPGCVTETAEGKKIDFDLLKQELSHEIVEGNKERYRLEWPGKREAIVTANLPITKTLRPNREDSVDFDKTENLYIEGDNLEVLKLLQESYLSKIKMIYIDPPYNTGKDFVYQDNFTQDSEEFKTENALIDEYNRRLVANPETSGRYHSDWLSMMYPRLKLARNLMTDDGIIFISIDDNEVSNLNKLCDEIFGEENKIGTLVWQSKKGGGSDSKTLVKDHEYILSFAKSRDKLNIGTLQIGAEPLDKKDDKGLYRRGRELNKWGSNSRRVDRPTMWFPIEGPNNEKIYPIRNDGEEGCWRYGKKNMELFVQNGDVDFVKREDGSFIVYEKIRDEDPRTKPYRTWVNDVNATSEGSIEVRQLFEGQKIFDFPKPSSLLNKCLSIGTYNSNDIVLDFFSGSASIAQSVLNFNLENDKELKFICVQLPELTGSGSIANTAGYKTIPEIGKERIRRAAKKFMAETNTNIDYGFRVYCLDESNMQDIYYRPQDYSQQNLDLFADNIKPDRTADDLVAQIMLDWGLQLSLPIDRANILGKEVIQVAGNSLFACFDSGIDEAFAKEVAAFKPLRIVFRDKSFKDDTAKENVRQLLKQLSPATEMRVL